MITKKMEKKDLKNLDVESIIQLAMELIDQHRTEGCHSSLAPGLMAKLHFKLSQAQVYHDESEKYQRLCEQAKHRRDAILGLTQPADSEESVMMDYLRKVATHRLNRTANMKAAS